MDVYEGEDNYIFVSYAHKDREQALRFVEALQKHCNVWYDNGIHAGNEWADKIADKLLHCSLFLFLVSAHSLSSDNCKDELALARDSGKPFINVRLEDVSFQGGMQLRYGRYQYFDFFRYEDADAAVRELLKSESFAATVGRQEVLRRLVDDAKTMMARTEEASPNLSESNADYLVQFRTVNATVAFGEYGGAPVKWDILQVTKDRALLVSQEILEAKAFDDDRITYDDSQIREWLNTVFLETAFRKEERQMLAPLGDLQDKVSLLTQSQAESLFASDQDRVKYGTDHARRNGLWTAPTGAGWWWLSASDACPAHCVCRVYSNGRIGFDTDFDNANIGVVPVISVTID